MLQALHDKVSGTIAKIILALLIFVFSFFGIESYMTGRSETYVAKVGDHEISTQEFRSHFDQYRARAQSAMGASFDPQLIDNPAQKRKLLDGMIDEQLILDANAKLGIMIPAKMVQDQILQTPQFQTDGKFDPTQYRAVLGSIRKTPREYDDSIRKDLLARQIPAQIMQSSFVTDYDIDSYLRLRDEKRSFRYLTLDQLLVDAPKVTDMQMEEYFKQHTADFNNPEKVAIEYVELDGAKLRIDITPDEATLKVRYEKEKSRFISVEQREASHILVKLPQNADAEAQKKGLQVATEIAKQAKTKPADFSKLAKERSEDLGSKTSGGDLGWLEKGVTEPAFEAALFAMNKGDVSDPVLSPEGYHIIQLRDVRAQKERSFAEVKPDLIKELIDIERDHVYAEAAGKLTDQVLANPGSLEPAAKAVGLSVQKTAPFARQGGGEGITADPAVLKIAFSDAVLGQGNISDPVQLGPNHMVLLRIAENGHVLSTPKKLDEVRAQINLILVAQQQTAHAKKQADEFYARLSKGENLDKLAAELKLKVSDAKDILRADASLDSKLVADVFAVPRAVADKPIPLLVALANNTYALAQITSMVDGDPRAANAATRDSVRSELSQGIGYEATKGFIASLRKQAKIKVVEDRM